MSEIVFILGAGASKQAGAPLMLEVLDFAESLMKKSPDDLGEDVENFRLVFDALEALQRVHSKSNMDLQNFESVFAAFEMAQLLGSLGDMTTEQLQRLREAMVRTLIKTLEFSIEYPVGGSKESPKVFPPRPFDKFLHLAKSIYPNHSMSIVTFNYDLALDYAFHFHNFSIDYGLQDDPSRGRFKVLKLHGSLNWAQTVSSKKVIPWHLDDYFKTRRWIDPWGMPFVRLRMDHDFEDFLLNGEPVCRSAVLVPPTWAKTQYYSVISPVWASAAKELRDAERIAVCGYSLPDSDHFFRYLYGLGTISRTRLKRFLVVDPDPARKVIQRFNDLLGPDAKDRYQYTDTTFEAALDRIQELLGIS